MARAWKIQALAGVAAGLVAAHGAPAQPAARVQPDERPAQAAEPGEDEDRLISFPTGLAEPLDLRSFVDWLAAQLDINVFLADADLAGRSIEFRSAVRFRQSEALSFLQTMLAQHGYGMTRTREGLYMITSTDRMPVSFDGEFATTRVIPTPLVRPSALQPALSTIVGQGLLSRASFLDDLGVIIITAPPRVNDTVEQVVQRLVAEQKGVGAQSFDLTHVAADEARKRILELVGQAAPTAEGAQGASFANLRDRLLIDRQGNSLILRGSQREAEELADLIAVVDAPSRLVIRRYAAGSMSRVIATYGSRLGLGPVATASSQQDEAFVGSGFLMDEEGEAFTFYGTESQHERVDDLVDEFAEQVQGARMVVEFYKLQNARAEETAGLLNELLEIAPASDRVGQSPFITRSLEGQRNIRRVGSDFGVPEQTPATAARPADTTGAPAPAGAEGEQSITPVEGVAIIPDLDRNQLIVRAPVRQQREISRIIEKIDKRRPQVYLEAQIVTVNASKSFRLSVDTALTNPSSDVPIFTNFGLITDPRDVESVRTPLDGFTAAVIRNDYVPFVVNALATEGDGRVLSTPRVLVNDNETADLRSTTGVAFAQTSQAVGAPSQTSVGGTIETGTTLSVTPQISEGGFIRLEFDIELSSFGEQPNPDLPPNTRRDNVASSVTIPSDSTVVIGGLSFESQNDSVSKIPILGNLPLLGHAFRSTTKSSSQTTLYIFITPRVLRDPTFADLRLLTRGPAQDLGLTLADDLPDLVPALMPIFGAGESAPVEQLGRADAPAPETDS